MPAGASWLVRADPFEGNHHHLLIELVLVDPSPPGPGPLRVRPPAQVQQPREQYLQHRLLGELVAGGHSQQCSEDGPALSGVLSAQASTSWAECAPSKQGPARPTAEPLSGQAGS